ncbi:hypothetical protein PILCRDRAFT_500515 [Piloderma croceum F 1598]|uniref:Uncharacterized protein n=1 Tax=Piloderma croceum (strain F 1598) TaxID=765440 RepID=A0A0C3FQG0_PILCF|nr:hypothetical protein PILCRDRAFT_500515 [Piloderma croceum F 1598]
MMMKRSVDYDAWREYGGRVDVFGLLASGCLSTAALRFRASSMLIRCAVDTRYAIGRSDRLVRVGDDGGRKQTGNGDRYAGNLRVFFRVYRSISRYKDECWFGNPVSEIQTRSRLAATDVTEYKGAIVQFGQNRCHLLFSQRSLQTNPSRSQTAALVIFLSWLARTRQTP